MGTVINFNDTSEYMFRNSSIKKGGFDANVGYQRGTSDLDVEGAEDVTQTQELLTEADRAQLRSMINALTVCTTEQLCSDKSDLRARANQAWNRALNLYPVYREQLDAELEDLRAEMFANILMWENQWARTAGSSLNCLVQGMRNKAVVDLSRRMSAAIAESNLRMKEHETEALARAFDKELQSVVQPTQMGLNQIGTLFQILRGARAEEVTDRDYTENRDETTSQSSITGRFYYEGTEISDNAGEYGQADAAIATANPISSALAAIIDGILPG